MALSGARNIEVGGIRYQWKANMIGARYRGWAPKTIRLVVQAPNGSTFTTSLESKRWLPEHRYGDDGNARPHKAVFTPGDVRFCIEAALNAGWSPQARQQRPFVLSPAPEVTDYGPPDAPRDESWRRYGPCHHGVRGYCWECGELAQEIARDRERLAAIQGPKPNDQERECCLVCFRIGSMSAYDIKTGKMPERFRQSPWRIVQYDVGGRTDFGVVCCAEHEEKFYSLVRKNYPSAFERLLDNLKRKVFEAL